MRRPFSFMSGHHRQQQQRPLPQQNHPGYVHPNIYAHPHPAGQPYLAYPAVHHTHAYVPYPTYAGHPVSPQYLDYQYNRKRQRRQAAAVVVQSLWDKNMGRKSTAQPRPVLNVPPRGIGPIADPNENDVLCGRGGRINSHAGNVQFRDVINAKKKEYLAPTTKKLEKAHIAAGIVNDIRGMNPPGRFLKEERDGMWYDIGDAKAIKKTGQALREDAPDIRPDLGDNSSGDEKSPKKGEKKASPKKDEKKSDKPSKESKSKTNSPNRHIPQARGPQHTVPNPENWQQQQGNGFMNPQEFQAQLAMPPPFSQQPNPYMAPNQQQPNMTQNQNAFGIRNIPIQAPNMQSVMAVPNQMYTGARSVGQKMASMSKQAVDTLSQTGRFHQKPPEDVAFGRTFHPPTELSSGNTMSTISGLSDPISSGIGMDTGSGLMSRGSKQGTSPNRAQMRSESMRLSQIMGGQSTRSQFASSRLSSISDGTGMQFSSRMSDLTNSVRSMNSVMSSFSLARSNSFPDLISAAEREAWEAIMEDDKEEVFEDLQAGPTSTLSGGSSGRLSFSSRQPGTRLSSNMSLASMSTGSSNRWLAGISDTMMDDGRSILSEMSSDLNALDLASDSRL